eukprot:SAG11_NODE_1159_length_5656_cov_5.909942_3_plen_93_part_00
MGMNRVHRTPLRVGVGPPSEPQREHVICTGCPHYVWPGAGWQPISIDSEPKRPLQAAVCQLQTATGSESRAKFPVYDIYKGGCWPLIIRQDG